MSNTVYTIGHSTHTAAHLISLLKQHSISALVDVRSQPYSRLNPQFNRETLKNELKRNGIAYVFLGKELGARSDDPVCYESGKVQYDRLARTALFRQGIERVLQGMQSYRIALMCAEKDPLQCHRTILVSRYLEAAGLQVKHILEDGQLESHPEAVRRLMRELGFPEHDLFRSEQELVAEAYRRKEQKIAYDQPERTGAMDTVRQSASQ